MECIESLKMQQDKLQELKMGAREFRENQEARTHDESKYGRKKIFTGKI